eukprot:Lankesteria_metandrocarpae@DN2756_c0_g1_i1.p1
MGDTDPGADDCSGVGSSGVCDSAADVDMSNNVNNSRSTGVYGTEVDGRAEGISSASGSMLGVGSEAVGQSNEYNEQQRQEDSAMSDDHHQTSASPVPNLESAYSTGRHNTKSCATADVEVATAGIHTGTLHNGKWFEDQYTTFEDFWMKKCKDILVEDRQHIHSQFNNSVTGGITGGIFNVPDKTLLHEQHREGGGDRKLVHQLFRPRTQAASADVILTDVFNEFVKRGTNLGTTLAAQRGLCAERSMELQKDLADITAANAAAT